MMKTVTACDEYQALFHVAHPPCRKAVWHFNKRLYRNLKGFILNYTDLLGCSGEVTSLQALVYSLLKEGNVVQMFFIKCSGHSRKNLGIISGDFGAKTQKISTLRSTNNLYTTC